MVEVVRTTLRLLTFRATRQELLELDNRHLVFGLVCTLFVGMGRYWDNPKAELVQRLGVGSIVYVFALGALLWVFLSPLRLSDFSYKRLVTFLTLVSPPAALYAIPVERFLPLETAQTVNAWFLAVVAVWRVGLLCFFLVRLGQLSVGKVLIGSLLPLAILVTALAILNLEHVVWDIMAGNRVPSAHDDAYGILVLITLVSVIASPVLLIAWITLVVDAWDRSRASRQPR